MLDDEEAALGLESRTDALGLIVPAACESKAAGWSRKGEGRGPGKKGELGDENAESGSEAFDCCEAREDVRERPEEEKLVVIE